MTDQCSMLDSSICRHPVIGPQIVQPHDCATCIAFNGRESEELTALAEYRERVGTSGQPQISGQCKYLGSKRRCCGALYICRQAPATNCVLRGEAPTGVRACDTCEFFEPLVSLGTGVLKVMPLSQQQIDLADELRIQPPPDPDPFTGQPVVHFGAHLWPVRGNWEWHVDRWNEIAATVNGRCVIGIATDETTALVDAVRDKLSARFEVYSFQNQPDGENQTFRMLQDAIPGGPDDVLIYCHGKGVREHTAASEAVRIWSEIMYETVAHNRQRITEKLAAGYKCFGSFRTFGDTPLYAKNAWHYSGTFFAVRSKHLRDKPIQNLYGGVEAWCGDHFRSAESWCEFTDGPGLMLGYDIESIYPAIVDAQMQWEVDRIGGPRCEQHKRELDWFIEWLNPTDRILVIGSKHGGLEAAIKRRLSGVQTVSVDIAPQEDNTQEVIAGSSIDKSVQDAVIQRGPFDAIFIDGDHSYAGVRSDWEFARSFDPRLIAFHDIAEAIKHRKEGCCVDRFWKEIKESGRDTAEMIVGCGWGGIGLVIRSSQRSD